MSKIIIPHQFQAKEHQFQLFEALRTKKRAFAIWHRRAGKDKTAWNLIIKEAVKKTGIYYYILPTYVQAKKILWDNFEMMHHLPPQIVQSKNSVELKITLINKSIIQLIGGEKYDSIRGTDPIGVVFSEWAFTNPQVWEIVRPILAKNGGWAIFITTPNGKNHAFELFQNAQKNPEWFSQILTVDDTNFIDPSAIQEDIRSGMSPEMIQQEYYCSFEIGAIGSYYAKLISAAREENRIGFVEFFSEKNTDVFLDIGVNDSFALWFKQSDGQKINLVGYHESHGKTLDYYFSYIDDFFANRKGKLGKIYLPHDGRQKGQSYLVAGKTIEDLFIEKYNASRVQLIPNKISVNDGIQAVRQILPRCFFDENRCDLGLKALENYQKDWDDVKKVFRKKARHDWASHAADAFRYLAISQSETQNPAQSRAQAQLQTRSIQKEIQIDAAYY